MELKVFLLRPLLVGMPEYKTAGSSGLDLQAAIDVPLILEPWTRALLPCGLAIEVPPGYEGQVRPRSGLANFGVETRFGTIDSDYRGEIGIDLRHFGKEPYTIMPGERVAQLVIAPVLRVEPRRVYAQADLSPTQRGAAGFGSTGR